jgi:hypothetical protein
MFAVSASHPRAHDRNGDLSDWFLFSLYKMNDSFPSNTAYHTEKEVIKSKLHDSLCIIF